MPAPELVEWMTYDELEPIGPVRGDLRAGIIAAAVFNAAGARPPMTPGDFMPLQRAARPPQTAAQMQAEARRITRGYNRQRRRDHADRREPGRPDHGERGTLP